MAGTLAITGLNFIPYPDADRDELAARVADIPATHPVGWIWFPEEVDAGDQAAAMRQALTSRGIQLAPADAVAGNLSFSQAWTRALLWAAQDSR